MTHGSTENQMTGGLWALDIMYYYGLLVVGRYSRNRMAVVANAMRSMLMPHISTKATVILQHRNPKMPLENQTIDRNTLNRKNGPTDKGIAWLAHIKA